jgi:hypothetical protein
VRRSILVAALVLAPAALAAQQPVGMFPSPPPQKPVRFQVFGGMTIPLAYNYYTAVDVDDIAWHAGGSLIYRPPSMYHVRVEGEYHAIGTDGASNAQVYGGGIGGGRAVSQGTSSMEGYFLAGLYNVEVCVANLTGGCQEGSELQFGTKLGANFAVGRGKVNPVLGFGWLYTWSSPYVSAITISGGLRF